MLIDFLKKISLQKRHEAKHPSENHNSAFCPQKRPERNGWRSFSQRSKLSKLPNQGVAEITSEVE